MWEKYRRAVIKMLIAHLASSPTPFLQPPDHLVELEKENIRRAIYLYLDLEDCLCNVELYIPAINPPYLLEIHPLDRLPI